MFLSFSFNSYDFAQRLRLSGGFQLSPDFRQRASSNASSCGRLSPIRALDLEPEWGFPQVDYQNATMTQAQVDQLASSMSDELKLHSDLLQQQGSVVLIILLLYSTFCFDGGGSYHCASHTLIHTHIDTDTRTDCMCIISCENLSCVNCSIKSTSVLLFFSQPNDHTAGAGSVPHPAFPRSPRRRRIRPHSSSSSNRRSRHNSNSHSSYHKATRSMDPSPSQPAAMPRCNLSRR